MKPASAISLVSKMPGRSVSFFSPWEMASPWATARSANTAEAVTMANATIADSAVRRADFSGGAAEDIAPSPIQSYQSPLATGVPPWSSRKANMGSVTQMRSCGLQVVWNTAGLSHLEVRLRHKTDMPAHPLNVRYQGLSGREANGPLCRL